MQINFSDFTAKICHDEKISYINFPFRPFLIVAQKTEYRDISGQFFLKSHLIVTKTRNIMEKIFRDRFCHGISADIP